MNQDDDLPSIAQARKGEGKMSREDLQSIMHGMIDDAELLVDAELSPMRAKASSFYFGEPFGNESDGRSQFVVTEVRDVIHGLIPSLMRVFTGPESVVEYAPRKAAGVAIAEQATDYAQYVLMDDNQGFLKIRSVLMDGLVRKIGIFKWYWDEESKRAFVDEDVSVDDLNTLAMRDDVTITSLIEDADGDEDEEGQATKTFTVEYTVKTEGRLCIDAVPPEEFLFNRGARDPEEAMMLGHRCLRKRGDLIAMGISEAEIDEHGGNSDSLGINIEAVERNLNINTSQTRDVHAGDANEDILLVEAYPYLDLNGDGERELCKVVMIGPQHHVVGNPEPVDERPLALFCPIPEPHTMIGQSEADLLMDLQLVKSSITRSMLDSLALSIFPRMTFLEGAVSVEDLLNTEIGAPIRIKRDGAVVPISHPFTGQAAMPVLEYFDAIGESRVGRAKGAMGLDADALQSTNAQGVAASVGATAEAVEMLARIFAEQTLKPLFRGIYRALVKHKPAARLVKLRGSYVTITTAEWDAEMDVTVNVALGTSNTAQRLGYLTSIIAEQKEILTTMGPVNPLTSLAQYSRSLQLAAQLAGWKDPSRFFNQVAPNWAPPQPGPPPPTAEETNAQTQLAIERMRTDKDLQIKQAELTLKQQKQSFEQDLELRKLAHDYTLRRYQIDAQFKADFTEADLARDAAADAEGLKGMLQLHQQTHEQSMAERQHALDLQQQQHDQALAGEAQDHEHMMTEQAPPGAAA